MTRVQALSRQATVSDRTVTRYRMREVAQRLTKARGVAICGRRAAFSPDGFPSVSLRVESVTGRSYFAGCTRCNSVWECPVCAPRIMAGRAADLGKLNDAHTATGGAMYLVTLTLPHDEGDALKPLRRAVSRAWTAVTRGAPWKRWRERLGMLGTVRALEVTHGRNGWHPHLHVAVYASRAWSDDERGSLRLWLSRQWSDAVTHPPEGEKAYRAPSAEHGVTVQSLKGSEYLAKMGLGHELASASTKEGRAEHRTPWQILRDLTAFAYADDAREDLIKSNRRLWREFTNGIRGARQLTFSVGLRARYGLGSELPDDALADAQGELEPLAPGASEVVAVWSPGQWRRVCALGVSFRLMLLEVALRPRDEWQQRIWQLEDLARGYPPLGANDTLDEASQWRRTKRHRTRQ